ncbi:hypothetical protein R1sor_001591 [Riccia sorocarpa]|uniref:Chromatin target of PRMT1 protein C-terminal domain-containing protein n=1 Tax=Riccia sorocarpa TaxID=122646 RepID=A0ABD3H2A4_9MARC
MQGGRGGSGRHGYHNTNNFGHGYGTNYGTPAAGGPYGRFPAYGFSNSWVPYGHYQTQNLIPMVPVAPRSVARGSAPGAFVPLGVQGAGVLKRPSGPPQGQVASGGRSGRRRSRSGRSRGGRDRDRDRERDRDRDRGRKHLTKEALDAELEEYRMKDKKLGTESLDAELDDYKRRKKGNSNEKSSDTQTEEESRELGEAGGSGEEQEEEAGRNTSSRRGDVHEQTFSSFKIPSVEKGSVTETTRITYPMFFKILSFELYNCCPPFDLGWDITYILIKVEAEGEVMVSTKVALFTSRMDGEV